MEPPPARLTLSLVVTAPGCQLSHPVSEQGSSVCTALPEGLTQAGSFKHHSQGFLEQGMPELPDLWLKTNPSSQFPAL